MNRFNVMRDTVRERRAQSQSVYTNYYNKTHHATKPSFAEGEAVYMKRCLVRPSKFDLLYEGLYRIKKVYDTETFGTMLRLENMETGAEVRSLIKSDRVKKAYTQQTSSKTSKTDPMVTITGVGSPESPIIVEVDVEKVKQAVAEVDNKSEQSRQSADEISDVDRIAAEKRMKATSGLPRNPGSQQLSGVDARKGEQPQTNLDRGSRNGRGPIFQLPQEVRGRAGWQNASQRRQSRPRQWTRSRNSVRQQQ